MEATMPAGRPFTVSEAKRLEGELVYGLAGPDGDVFYVGKTKSPKRRFQSHRENRSANVGLRQRIAKLGDDLRVIVLHHAPEDINGAERNEIRARKSDVVNLIGADHWSWAANSEVPWSAGTGIKSPLAYAVSRCSASFAKQFRAWLKGLSPKERCLMELRFLQSLPMAMQSDFAEWQRLTAKKMAGILGPEHAAV